MAEESIEDTSTCPNCKKDSLSELRKFAGKCSWSKDRSDPNGQIEYTVKKLTEYSCFTCSTTFFRYKTLKWTLSPQKFNGLVGEISEEEESLIEAQKDESDEDMFVLGRKNHLTLLKGGLHKDFDLEVANTIITAD